MANSSSLRAALLTAFVSSFIVLTGCTGGGGGETPTAVTDPVDPPAAPPMLAAPPPAELQLGTCESGEAATAERVEAMAPGELAQFVVAFDGDGGVEPALVNRLAAMGLSGRYMQYTPVAGVMATKAQIQQIMGWDAVRSVRFNDPVVLDDATARYLTSVDKLIESTPEITNAEGEAITGKGVTILVNDSGVDATHQDLQFGTKVVANASAYTNVRSQGDLVPGAGMLPFTPLEDVPNSDVGGSHGTHVAGIAGGDGSASGGTFAGVARGANIAGYGSGAVLLILDTIGGFDYAMKLMTERPEINLRIVTNSFGSPSDAGTCFDPEDPTNVVTKMLADAGIIVVFSAGNSGSGPDTITGNYKKAPWIVIAGNGEKSGLLAPSSSRGTLANGVYEVEVDGETMIVEDRPTVVTPGTNYIAARAVAADPFIALDAPDDAQSGDIPPELVPFYTRKTGTSMAAPHLAGIVALMLEANPDLTWREVKPILKATATNMPGYEPWEVGAGFANAEAAVAMAQGLRDDYGRVNLASRGFFANVGLGDGATEQYTIDFAPLGETTTAEFEVAGDVALVLAQWTQPLGDPCTCAIVLEDPEGNTFGSGIPLPVLGPSVAAVAPGMAGTWKLYARGIGSVSGTSVDPTGQTNGLAGPSTLDVDVTQLLAAAPEGVDDVFGHPAESIILAAVGERLVDGTPTGFMPDAALIRAHLAEYLASWGLRQTRPHLDTSTAFADTASLPPIFQHLAEVTTTPGLLLLDPSPVSAPLIRTDGAAFDPLGLVTLEEMAYGLIQAKGFEGQGVLTPVEGPLTFVDDDGNTIEIADTNAVTPDLLSHVQAALDLRIITPVIAEGVATLSPQQTVSRADYARAAMMAFATTPFPS